MAGIPYLDWPSPSDGDNLTVPGLQHYNVSKYTRLFKGLPRSIKFFQYTSHFSSETFFQNSEISEYFGFLGLENHKFGW